jgi:hypothetical protein
MHHVKDEREEKSKDFSCCGKKMMKIYEVDNQLKEGEKA